MSRKWIIIAVIVAILGTAFLSSHCGKIETSTDEGLTVVQDTTCVEIIDTFEL